MNIGPRGDGEMDVKDVTILKGIGDWIAKNKASIYDAAPSDLPLQSWGVTTQKTTLFTCTYSTGHLMAGCNLEVY